MGLESIDRLFAIIGIILSIITFITVVVVISKAAQVNGIVNAEVGRHISKIKQHVNDRVDNEIGSINLSINNFHKRLEKLETSRENENVVIKE